jgi:hemolysin activation/secretion protein
MNSKIIFSAFCAVNLMATFIAANACAEPQDPQQHQPQSQQSQQSQQPQSQQQPPREHRKPPRPAIDACNGKKQGDKVNFLGRFNENISGTCTQMKDVLAARPEGGPVHDEKGAQ